MTLCFRAARFGLRVVPVLCLGVIGAVEERKNPSLPKPNQVDKPGMIRFIKPDPNALPGIVVDDGCEVGRAMEAFRAYASLRGQELPS